MKLLRTTLGITQAELAKAIGRDHSLISLAESGQPIGAKTTRQLFDCYRQELTRLGLTAEDFIRGERAA